MNNYYSIKALLATLVPMIGYESLAISNGTDANAASNNLPFERINRGTTDTRLARSSIMSWIRGDCKGVGKNNCNIAILK